MISLSDATGGVQKSPLVIIEYGPPGIGKTTLAAQAPGVIFLPTEPGTKQLNVRRLPQPSSLDDVLGVLKQLAHDKHDYQTLAIDTITGLQDLVYASTCAKSGKGYKHIEDFGYGKGYAYALADWHRLIAGLEPVIARGMNVILIAHETLRRMPNPGGADYDQRVPHLYKDTVELLFRWVDGVFHLTYKMAVTVADGAKDKSKGKGYSTGARLIRTQWRPEQLAKNRWNLPYEMPLDWSTLIAAIEAFGAQDGTIEAFAAEARNLLDVLVDPAERARCEAQIATSAGKGDLPHLQRIVTHLRGLGSVEPVTA